ncbi:neuronal acetylcholine receptor subunit alpha-5-like [Haliotis rufescens]|uniref:neuronal acetylcholine receptor subunit alpha-5-like n=1 Tax=Haliotis rufescens TaxID=6454 RepID=UPI00201EE334|nr:neuronal acetylcholine receptor subunit alpha-5-like [Haliotis rufescens]
MEASLHQHIFNNYNKRVRPGDVGEAVNISVDVVLDYLLGLDEKNQMLSTGMHFIVKWVDKALSWNETEFPGLHEIFVPDTQIWIPEIAIPKALRTNLYLKAENYLANIKSNGTVKWVPNFTGNTQCSIDTTRFPFDNQTCLITASVWVYETKQTQIVETKVLVEPSVKENGQWEVSSVLGKLVPDRKQRNGIVVTLNIRRRREYYLVSLILPAVVTSFLNPFVFLLPAESGEKVGLATTLMLFYSVMLSVIFGSIPANSLTMPIFGMFIGGQLILSALSIACTVVLLKLRPNNRDEAVDPKTERPEDGNKTKINCENGQWEIISVLGKLDQDRKQRNVIVVTLNIRRRREYYLVSLILPAVVTSFLNPFVFLLPAESGEKVGLATTLMLFYSVMLSVIFGSIPANSLTMPIFGMFIGGQLILSALSIACTVVLLKLRPNNRDKAVDPKTESNARFEAGEALRDTVDELQPEEYVSNEAEELESVVEPSVEDFVDTAAKFVPQMFYRVQIWGP